MSKSTSVRLATTTAVNLSTPPDIDGEALVSGNKILVKDQTTIADNGIYTVSGSQLVRSSGFSLQDLPGLSVLVEEGDTNAKTCWLCVTEFNTAAPPPASVPIIFGQVQAVTAANLADKSGAAMVGFIQGGTGAIGRTAQDKLREVLSVADFTTVAQAVAEAIARGADLYWPDGAVNVTGNIPNLHAVRHHGPGRITRGGDTFYPDPTSDRTNTLYLTASGGSASNDGLTAALPINTLTNVFAVLANYGPHLVGTWTIQHVAGSYSGYHRVPYQLTSERLIRVLGASVGGHPSVPTTIYGASGTGNKVIEAHNPGLKLYVQDIKAVEYEN